jgi:fructose-1-phosphate kinase PfkB-like protein
MIYTCTLNPSIDYLVEMEDVQLGTLNRSNKTSFYPGGKGINVSASISLDFYQSLAALCQDREIPFVIDVSGPALKGVLKYKPILIKPNQHELGELVGSTISSKEEAVIYAKELLTQGIRNVIVSMGGEGAVLVNNEMTAYATVPKGVLKNSVGAGDSTVAGFIASYVQHGNVIEALLLTVQDLHSVWLEVLWLQLVEQAF